MAIGALGACCCTQLVMAAVGGVLDQQKISATAGDLPFELIDFDRMGVAMAAVGDLDGDAVPEIVVRLHNVSDEHTELATLFLSPDGTVKAHANADQTSDGTAVASNFLGVTRLGDLDGDGDDEIAVTSWSGLRGDAGSVWILHLTAAGTTSGSHQILPGVGGFDVPIQGHLGSGIAGIGDLDGDGVPDLAVEDEGNPRSDYTGGLCVLLLNADGTVKSSQRIDATNGGFDGTLGPSARFAHGIAGAGDVNGDKTPDIAVTAPGDDQIWVLLMNGDGTAGQSIASDVPELFDDIAGIGDRDMDGVPDLAVRASHALSIVLLQASGAAMSIVQLGNPEFEPSDPKKALGYGFPLLVGDVNGDGVPDLAAGFPTDDDGGNNTGAVWMLMMEDAGSPPCWAADVVADGVVGIDDLLLVMGDWKTGPNGDDDPPEEQCLACDIDGDGLINTDDVLIVIQNWGECPGPCCLGPGDCVIDVVSQCNANGGTFTPGVGSCDDVDCPE